LGKTAAPESKKYVEIKRFSGSIGATGEAGLARLAKVDDRSGEFSVVILV
jgi:hypothetical protein